MNLKKDQQKIIEAAREFSEGVLLPRAAEFDERQLLPQEIISELAKKKFLLASLPKAWGGLGLDPVHYGLFTEEIGKSCCSTRGLVTVQSSLIGETLLKWGSEEQKKKWLIPIAESAKLGAFALTEPEAGTDARGIRTAYAKTGGEYVITGRKKWISFAGIAHFMIVLAARGKEITAFLAETDRPGVKITPQKGLLANRAAHIAEIEFDKVKIPEMNVIGQPGSGFSFIAATALDHGRYSIAWAGVAIAQAALESMTRYSMERSQFGSKIGEFQLIQRLIGNAVAGTHAARALCLKAGEMRARGEPDAVAETMIAKYFASKTALKAAADAVQVHGGNGCWNRFPAERLYREAKLLEIIEGTSQIAQQIIARYGLRTQGGRS